MRARRRESVDEEVVEEEAVESFVEDVATPDVRRAVEELLAPREKSQSFSKIEIRKGKMERKERRRRSLRGEVSLLSTILLA